MAWAPVFFAAAMMLGMFRYDWEDGAGPMQTFSSDICTARVFSSAVE